jgi:hypothetical protein
LVDFTVQYQNSRIFSSSYWWISLCRSKSLQLRMTQSNFVVPC